MIIQDDPLHKIDVEFVEKEIKGVKQLYTFITVFHKNTNEWMTKTIGMCQPVAIELAERIISSYRSKPIL